MLPRLFLVSFFSLLMATSAVARNWICVEENTVGIWNSGGSWKPRALSNEKWILKWERAQYVLSNFSLEEIKKRDKKPSGGIDLSFYCEAGLNVICEGGLGSRFQFNPETLRFVTHSKGIGYLMGGDKDGTPGPTVAVGACSRF
ncbi:MAG: hypothetical protein ABJJ37_05670 [Roseibium sp.]